MKYVLLGLLHAYRLVISPLYGDVCRYYPSCSAYAVRAVDYHGALRGSWYAARRLLRCHPWTPGGYDPVPGTPEHAEELREQAQQAAEAFDGTGPAVTELDRTEPAVTELDRTEPAVTMEHEPVGACRPAATDVKSGEPLRAQKGAT